MDVTLAIEDPRAPAVRALVDLLDAELASKYPEASNIATPDLARFTPPGGLFVVARDQNIPVACGALVFVSQRQAEVKRMFVHPDHRGRGLSRRVLAELEARARGLGCVSMRLETGLRQPEALALYRSAGYVEIAKYAPFEDDPLSVCFSKAL